VFAVTDASGGVSVEAHERAIQRMVQAGAVPITWMAVLSEWQRDWVREESIVYQGEFEHRDCSGGGGKIGPGDVQWMTAGRAGCKPTLAFRHDLGCDGRVQPTSRRTKVPSYILQRWKLDDSCFSRLENPLSNFAAKPEVLVESL